MGNRYRYKSANEMKSVVPSYKGCAKKCLHFFQAIKSDHFTLGENDESVPKKCLHFFQAIKSDHFTLGENDES